MSWHRRAGAQQSAESLLPPRCPPARRAAHAKHKRRARLPGRKGPRPPSRTRPPAPCLTEPWPAPGGAAGREAAALQPVMLGPGAAPPGLPRAPGSRRQLGLALPGGARPTRAEVAEKEARAGAGRTDRHAGQWEAGSGRGTWLQPGSAPRARFLSAAPSCAGFLGVNSSEAARKGSPATPTAGGGMCFGGAGWYPVP